MNITIYGSGYVGLVTAACLAQVGNQILCVDVDAKRIEQLRQGLIPFHEPGLDTLVHSNLESGSMMFTTDAGQGVEHGLLQFIAVGTPAGKDGFADICDVLTVAQTIARHMDDYRTVVYKSTVPVGTASKIKQMITGQLDQRGCMINFDVVSNPEFLREGSAVNDFMEPDRIIIGTDSEKAETLMRELYAPFGRERIQIMDPASSEFSKYAANAMLAARISLMNELANLAEHLGVDIELARAAIGADPRIGSRYIHPGCGYGGSCFPKDVKALMHMARQTGADTHMLAAIDATNRRQQQVLFEKISRYFRGELQDKVIAVWGLAFKPGTDDMREAPSRTLMHSLWDSGAKVRAFDPVAMDACRRIYGEHPGLQLCVSPEEVLHKADALAILTEWEIFRQTDPEKIRRELSRAVIFDGRNLYDPDRMRTLGFYYDAIGRGDSSG